MTLTLPTSVHCETCGEGEVTGFSYRSGSSPENGTWKFTCNDCSNDDIYDLAFEEFFRSPAATIYWLTALQNKRFFRAGDFLAMVGRLQKAARFQPK